MHFVFDQVDQFGCRDFCQRSVDVNGAVRRTVQCAGGLFDSRRSVARFEPGQQLDLADADFVTVMQQGISNESAVDRQSGLGSNGFQRDLAAGDGDDAVERRHAVASQPQVAGRPRSNQKPRVGDGPATETGTAAGHFQNEMDGQRQGRLIASAKFSLGRRNLRGNHTVNLLSTKLKSAGCGGVQQRKESAWMVSSSDFACHERIERARTARENH